MPPLIRSPLCAPSLNDLHTAGSRPDKQPTCPYTHVLTELMVAVGAVVEREGKVLLVQRLKRSRGYYEFPGILTDRLMMRPAELV